MSSDYAIGVQSQNEVKMRSKGGLGGERVKYNRALSLPADAALINNGTTCVMIMPLSVVSVVLQLHPGNS